METKDEEEGYGEGEKRVMEKENADKFLRFVIKMVMDERIPGGEQRKQKQGKTEIKGGCNAEHMEVEGWRSEGNSLRAHHSINFGAIVKKKCSFFHWPALDLVSSSGFSRFMLTLPYVCSAC